MVGTTISHEVRSRICGGAKVLLKPAAEGLVAAGK